MEIGDAPDSLSAYRPDPWLTPDRGGGAWREDKMGLVLYINPPPNPVLSYRGI